MKFEFLSYKSWSCFPRRISRRRSSLFWKRPSSWAPTISAPSICSWPSWHLPLPHLSSFRTMGSPMRRQKLASSTFSLRQRKNCAAFQTASKVWNPYESAGFLLQKIFCKCIKAQSERLTGTCERDRREHEEFFSRKISVPWKPLAWSFYNFLLLFIRTSICSRAVGVGEIFLSQAHVVRRDLQIFIIGHSFHTVFNT